MTGQAVFALVAGEASGDQLGAALIRELKSSWPEARFVGVGGHAMCAEGFEAWFDAEELAVFGLFEVLEHFPRLLRLRRELRRRIQQVKPLVFIGIDAPDFNLGLEKQLKSAGILTIHYVSPTVWAWRPRRVHKISRAVNLVLCLFPFEPAFYQGFGVAASYVGHPMANQIPMHTPTGPARITLGLNPERRVVALLPGSRKSEVSRLATPMIEAASILVRGHPDLQFVCATANPAVAELFSRAMADANSPPITLVDRQARTVMAAADSVICASGTATLETMLIKRPMVSAYRLSPATYQLAKTLRLFKPQFFALPNILAGEKLVPELIQREVSGERLAQETAHWLQDKAACRTLESRFKAIHQQLLGEPGQSAGSAVKSCLRETP